MVLACAVIFGFIVVLSKACGKKKESEFQLWNGAEDFYGSV